MAPAPISYAVDGEQYIARHGGPRLLGRQRRARRARATRAASSRSSSTARPRCRRARAPRRRRIRPSEIFSPAAVAAGAEPYRVYCSRCHGGETHSLNIIPDLRRSVGAHERRAVEEHRHRRRARAERHDRLVGVLEPAEAETIRAYVAAQARVLQEVEARGTAPATLRRRRPTRRRCNAPDRTNLLIPPRSRLTYL